jgi:hypothetical protein
MTPDELLAAVRSWPVDLRNEFAERAALIEDGCKCSREEAERRAFELLRPDRGQQMKLGGV